MNSKVTVMIIYFGRDKVKPTFKLGNTVVKETGNYKYSLK